MVLNLIDFLEKQGKVAFHKHDGWQEHPVAVKDHQKYFANLPPRQSVVPKPEGLDKPVDVSGPKERSKQDPLIKNPKMFITWEQVKQRYESLDLGSRDFESKLNKLNEQLGINKEFNAVKTSLHSWQSAYITGYVSLRAAINEINTVAEEKMDDERQFFVNVQKKVAASEFDITYNEGRQMAVGLLPIVWLTQQYLKNRYPEGFVDVYRGLRGRIAKEIDDKRKKMEPNDTLTIPHDGVSSYSLDRRVAKRFVDIDFGVILHKRIPINKILVYFPVISTYGNEEEVLVDSNVVQEFAKDEIEEYETLYTKVVYN